MKTNTWDLTEKVTSRMSALAAPSSCLPTVPPKPAFPSGPVLSCWYLPASASGGCSPGRQVGQLRGTRPQGISATGPGPVAFLFRYKGCPQ